MKPEYEARRKIIREWMSLPKDKRQTEEQAKPSLKRRWSESRPVTIREGQTIQYEVVSNCGKESAENLKVG
jgi:hypothetical protein